MLPSMPILFSNSQDAFGNKVVPSTSYFNPSLFQKPPDTSTPPTAKPVEEPPKVAAKETEKKVTVKKEKSKPAPPKINGNALETALVRSYYTKVQSKFSSNLNVPTNKFIQFQSILKSFDPSKESPVELYKKIEALFGDAHSDVVEEFLLFLKPGQAAQVGRFMDYFMLAQLTGFIQALHTAFARKPTVHRKILRALNNGINTGNSEQMKARVLPHLRSSPKIAEAFRALFPDERPPDSCYETGVDTLPETFLTDDTGYDTWELPDTSDHRHKLHPTETLDTMYLHGRVFLQHGRMLRPARVTYPYSKEPYRVHARRLAPDLSHPSPPESDEERSPKRQSKTTPKVPQKRAKRQPKSPTKTAKDVNDNTRKEPAVNSPRNKKQTNKRSNKKSESEANKLKKETKNQGKKDNNPEASKAKQARIEINANTDKKSDAKVSTDVRKCEGTSPNNETQNSDAKISTDVTKCEGTSPNNETQNSDAKISTDGNKSVDTLSTDVKKNDSVNITISADVKRSNWTRDEDKTMLQVLKGEAGSEQIFGKIKEMLPHRSPTEIKERFCHVMNLLQQMGVGGVT